MIKRIWDISEPIEEGTAVWPGDTPMTREWVMRMAEGHSCDVSTIRMTVHCGTHADSPAHYVEGGRDSAGSELWPYIGPCRVVAVTPVGDPALVPPAALDRLEGVARVLLRTSDAHDHRRFDEGFCALGPEAASRVVELGLRLVGIDTPSMDTFASKDLPSHKILSRGEVALLENLDLRGVPEGDYELIALPLRIVGSDASPVRAVLIER
ncbi:MAG: cyclase family protein [Planctomycetota bacterium]